MRRKPETGLDFRSPTLRQANGFPRRAGYCIGLAGGDKGSDGWRLPLTESLFGDITCGPKCDNGGQADVRPKPRKGTFTDAVSTQRWTIGMDALFLVFLVLAGIASCQAGLMLVHAWEHRRFYRGRLGEEAQARERSLRVTLIAPCKGIDADLRVQPAGPLLAALSALRNLLRRRIGK